MVGAPMMLRCGAANTMDEIGEIATQMEQIRQDMREKMALGKKNPTTLK